MQEISVTSHILAGGFALDVTSHAAAHLGLCLTPHIELLNAHAQLADHALSTVTVHAVEPRVGYARELAELCNELYSGLVNTGVAATHGDTPCCWLSDRLLGKGYKKYALLAVTKILQRANKRKWMKFSSRGKQLEAVIERPITWRGGPNVSSRRWLKSHPPLGCRNVRRGSRIN